MELFAEETPQLGAFVRSKSKIDFVGLIPQKGTESAALPAEMSWGNFCRETVLHSVCPPSVKSTLAFGDILKSEENLLFSKGCYNSGIREDGYKQNSLVQYILTVLSLLSYRFICVHIWLCSDSLWISPGVEPLSLEMFKSHLDTFPGKHLQTVLPEQGRLNHHQRSLPTSIIHISVISFS